MAAFCFDEQFEAPKFYNRISEVVDDLLFYHKSARPIVPKAFDSIVITECLHATENSSVYSGYFLDRQGKRYEEYDVAFKFGDEEQLCREAEKYDKMFRLQGKAIPRLIGLAFAKRTRGGYFACLMTEKFGSSLDCDLISLARSDKAIILSHLQSVHDKGLIHADFKESNVLQRGSEFRLVDFDHMRETHKCTASGKVINFSEQPDSFSMEDWDAICAYVRVPALDMDFWDDGTVFVKGYSWKKEGLPSARIMELLFPKVLRTKYDDTKELPDLLLRYFKHVQILLESGRRDIEYLKAHINETAAQVEKEWRSGQKKRPAPAEPPARAVRARVSKSNRRAVRTEVR
ncbi:hypothetical protein BDZ89DRAFT_1140280 [Hymenopellis radicata]|nr:hypothetical protein BDZ89DRAFT_1140280 [Hymenopellis radicata]